jgi:hypothetical protein
MAVDIPNPKRSIHLRRRSRLLSLELRSCRDNSRSQTFQDRSAIELQGVPPILMHPASKQRPQELKM